MDAINRKWIINSERRLFESFNSDIFSEALSNSGDRPYVTVLGPTQGGKTTLILRLIGLDGDDFKTVYDTLRGGMSLGRRATPCPTVYKISDDNDYRIRFEKNSDEKTSKKEIKCSEKDAVKHLNKIYENQNEIISKSIIHISIPRKRIKIINGLEPVMIDLPGFDGHGDDPETISAMYEDWVAKANCIFLVAFAEHMYKLNELSDPWYKEFPREVKLWKSDPNRFKIVLTAYLKNDSEQKFWRENTPDIKVLNDRILELLKSEDKGIANSPSWLKNTPDAYTVFVFDYGKYWFDLEEKDKNLTESFSPILDKHFKKLKESIKASTNEISKLRARCSPFNVLKMQYEIINKGYKEKTKILQNEINNIDETIKNNNNKIDSLKNTIASCNKDINTLENLLKTSLLPEELFEYERNIKMREEQIAGKFKTIETEFEGMLKYLNKNISKQQHKWFITIKLRQLSAKAAKGYNVEPISRKTYTQLMRIFEFRVRLNKKLDTINHFIMEQLNNWKRELKLDLEKQVIQPSIKNIDKLRYGKQIQLKQRNDCNDILIKIKCDLHKNMETTKEKEIASIAEFKDEYSKVKVFPSILSEEFKKYKEEVLNQINKPINMTEENSENKTQQNMNRICSLLYLCKGALLLNNVIGD